MKLTRIMIETDDGFYLAVSPKISDLTHNFIAIDSHRRFIKPVLELEMIVKKWAEKYLGKEQPNVSKDYKYDLVKPNLEVIK